MTTETCERCKFWDGHGTLGYCKAHAPVYENGHYPFTARWPQTESHDWCGDYKANPEVV